MQASDTCSYSVLMSIYKKENPAFLIQSLDSMLNQTVFPSEIVMVKDGLLTRELEVVLEEYDSKYPGLFNFVSYDKIMAWVTLCAEECSLALTKLLRVWILMTWLVQIVWRNSLPLLRTDLTWSAVTLLNL